jgi:hypothetical protein
LHSNRIKRFGTKPQLVQFSHGIGLKIDADSEGFNLRDGFKHNARNTDLAQGERNAQAANASTGDQY